MVVQQCDHDLLEITSDEYTIIGYMCTICGEYEDQDSAQMVEYKLPHSLSVIGNDDTHAGGIASEWGA